VRGRNWIGRLEGCEYWSTGKYYKLLCPPMLKFAPKELHLNSGSGRMRLSQRRSATVYDWLGLLPRYMGCYRKAAICLQSASCLSRTSSALTAIPDLRLSDASREWNEAFQATPVVSNVNISWPLQCLSFSGDEFGTLGRGCASKAMTTCCYEMKGK
jgi:hypothetical protein